MSVRNHLLAVGVSYMPPSWLQNGEKINCELGCFASLFFFFNPTVWTGCSNTHFFTRRQDGV